jgi:hypothetical protein
MPSIDVQLQDTQKYTTLLITGIEADSVEAACKHATKLLGWLWLGATKGDPNRFYAVNLGYFGHLNGMKSLDELKAMAIHNFDNYGNRSFDGLFIMSKYVEPQVMVASDMGDGIVH